jgi:two-component system, chemotaxis family, sensor kinase CheA
VISVDDSLNTQDEFAPDQILKELRATFKEEANELLAELEYALLELEKTPDDSEQIGRVFRAMHTIKGSGGACEFHEIVTFTHELESIFDKIRNGKASATKEIIDLTLMARDQIREMFDRYYQNGPVDEVKSREIITALRQLVPDVKAPESKTIAAESPSSMIKGAGRSVTYRIRFKPHREILAQGIDPLKLLRELRTLGDCKVVAQVESIPCLGDIDPHACYIYWDIILTASCELKTVEEVFNFVKENSFVEISIIDHDGHSDSEAAYKKLGEILLERGDLTNEDLEKALHSQKRVGEMLVETGIISPATVQSALVEQMHVREMREHRNNADTRTSVRVATDKLDSLVNLVGELVTVQARLSQTALTLQQEDLSSIAEEVERLTSSLRDNAMSIRMLPIGTTFSRFKRLVRDLSAELGKEIELTTDGAETELDKTVIERMSDPLVHIIRNSIDHGIEYPELRVAAGKARCGTIHLSAVHAGAHVLIRVEDDGAGLDAEAIRMKAVEKGLIQKDTDLAEDKIWDLIFSPGFSTAKAVTGVSGRGVGMDVVKRAIDALRGSITVSSSKGKGTSIILRLPLTLAIIDGFLTRVGGEHFIFPLAIVEECVELTPESSYAARGQCLANVRGKLVPYIRLREHFLTDGERPDFELIVITRVDNRNVGIVVDNVVGQYQTVIKSLGRFYRLVDGISGATILGDGTVALVLDVPTIVRQAGESEAMANSGNESFIT